MATSGKDTAPQQVSDGADTKEANEISDVPTLLTNLTVNEPNEEKATEKADDVSPKETEKLTVSEEVEKDAKGNEPAKEKPPPESPKKDEVSPENVNLTPVEKDTTPETESAAKTKEETDKVAEDGNLESDDKVEKDASSQEENNVIRSFKAVGFDIGGLYKVYIYLADITTLEVDAIVNAANGHLKHGGGVAKAIAVAAGSELVKDGQKIVKLQGEIPVSEVVKTVPGKLLCNMVFHAVGPKWPKTEADQKKVEETLTKTFDNVIAKAHKESLASIAIPAISSGIFGVPNDIVADAMYASLMKAAVPASEDEIRSCTGIHIVDIEYDFLPKIAAKFTDAEAKTDDENEIKIEPLPEGELEKFNKGIPIKQKGKQKKTRKISFTKIFGCCASDKTKD